MKKGYLLVVSTAIISGFSIFINKFGVSISNPYIFTWLKNLIVAIFLTGLIFIKKDWKILKSLTKKQWCLLIIIGLVGGSIPFLLFFKGLSLTNSTQASFIQKTMFIPVALLAFIFLKEKMDKRFLIGAVILIVANVLLLKKITLTVNQGDIFIFLATLLWAIENIISKYVLKLKNLAGRTIAWARMFFGSLFILIFLLGTGQASLLFSLRSSQIGWIIITSIILFGYVITWYSGIKYIPISQATVILLFGSPITTLLSLISKGEIKSQEILAGSLIILGIVFVMGFKESWCLIKEVKKLIYVRS